MLLYLGILLCVLAWKFVPRPWHPSLTIQRPHHTLFSTATREQTEQTADKLEQLYRAYSNCFGSLPTFERDHSPLKVKLFKDRNEFRKINPGLGWAEAFYLAPYCRAYFSKEEINPYHWMLHESTHQLNNEVARVRLSKWVEEGLATYFSTSRFAKNELTIGRVDLNTYPVWWLEEIATAPTMDANLRNGSIIPLRTIITNRGGPSMRKHFNLYYLHWWTLTHFIFQSNEFRSKAVSLVQSGGGLQDFERIIGPVEQVQQQWHDYVRKLKATLGDSPR